MRHRGNRPADFSICKILNTAQFGEDFRADSLDGVELVMALEKEFGTDIPDEEAAKITTGMFSLGERPSHPACDSLRSITV